MKILNAIVILVLIGSFIGCRDTNELDAMGKPLPPYMAESEFIVTAKLDKSRTEHIIYGPLLSAGRVNRVAWYLNLDLTDYKKVKLGDHIKSSSNDIFIYLENEWVNIKNIPLR